MPVTWDSSPNLTPVSGGTDFSRTYSVTGNGEAWVRIYLSTFWISEKFYTYAGAPAPVSVSVQRESSTVYRGTVVTPGESQTYEYSWTVPDGWTVSPVSIPGCPYMCSVLLTPPPFIYQEPMFIASAYNACGWNWGMAHVSTSSGSAYSSSVSAYPNPVFDILHIDINADRAVQNGLLQDGITGGKRMQTSAPVYDVRLYDGQGNLLRQKKTGGQAEFSVANLTSGIYYLHVYDGSGEKPEIRQIVVKP
jgi:hypothetical protein